MISNDGHAWQREVYRHLSICGEARYAVNFFGNGLARAFLGIAEPGAMHRSEWMTGQPENLTLDSIFPTPRAQAAFLKAAGVHLSAVGEFYLVGRGHEEYDNDTEGQVWEIVSVLEVSVQGDAWQIDYANGRKITLTEEDVVIRFWIPRPDNRMEADSAMRSMLPLLSEIEWETRHIFTQLRSRLIGAGVWFLPQNLTFPTPPAIDGEEQATTNEAESFMLMLAEAGMEVINNPDDPMYPITVMAPTEAYDKIDQGKLIKFWSEIDDKAMILRNDAIRRFALGMDLPPERVLGMAGGGGAVGDRDGAANHWTSWQIEEDTIKMHFEPMLDVICDGLSLSVIQPLHPGTKKIVVFDTTNLRLRPDRSKESIELFDRGLLAGAVTLRENGFDPAIDGMGLDERKLWMLSKIASGSASPEMVQAALLLVGIELPQVQPLMPESENIQVEQVAPETPQPPSIESHPTRPRTPDEASAVVAACEGLVLRALEKAGNRVLNDGRRGKDKHRGVEAHLAHTLVKYDDEDLFEGAFGFASVVLEGLADSDGLTPVLRDYCNALTVTQTAHTRSHLISFLNNRGVLVFPSDPKFSDEAYREGLFRMAVFGQQPQQPPVINLHQAPIEITIPEREVTFNVAPGQAPDVHIDVAAPEVTIHNDVPVPDVTVTNEVNPTPVEITNEVATPDVKVEVASPTVNVEAPQITVEAPKVNATLKEGKRKTTIQRDENGDIVGATETDA